MGAARTAVRLSPSFTGMSTRSDGMGPGFSARTPAGGSLGLTRAIGPAGNIGQPMGRSESSVMPPDFGYPFYQPPSPSAAESSGATMSSM